MRKHDSDEIANAALADRLNNILTGIALKSGLLQTRAIDHQLRGELKELEDLAIQAVALLRQLRRELIALEERSQPMWVLFLPTMDWALSVGYRGNRKAALAVPFFQ